MSRAFFTPRRRGKGIVDTSHFTATVEDKKACTQVDSPTKIKRLLHIKILRYVLDGIFLLCWKSPLFSSYRSVHPYRRMTWIALEIWCETHKYSRVNSCYYYFALFYTKFCLPFVASITSTPSTASLAIIPPKILFQFSPIFLSFIHVRISLHGIIFNFLPLSNMRQCTQKTSRKKLIARVECERREKIMQIKIQSYYDDASYDDTTCSRALISRFYLVVKKRILSTFVWV